MEELYYNIEPLLHQAGCLELARLGKMAESALAWALEHSSLYQLISSHFQIHQDKITLGELDFLVQHQHQIEHWELTQKFYLHHGLDYSSLETFYGPKGKDRLDLKINKMIHHQLPMGKHPLVAKAFSHLSKSSVISKAIIKGRLYYPFYDWLKGKFCTHELIQSNHLKGWWVTFKDWENINLLLIQLELNTCILTRSQWMSSELYFENPTETFNTDIDPLQLPLQILVFQSTPQGCHEVSRGFIVSDHWPEI